MLAVLVGVAVFAVVYIASFGKSGHHAEITPPNSEALAQNAASAPAFDANTVNAMTPASGPDAQTAAR
ncbi:hypothetical protein [Candidatus Burkholderia verschuerenii]|uniref:hypothetical protein n=1 Tax=Candidatus Burkholderia verschuerenii TaxID=242163 RepID=UPI0018DE7F40|nr:hypothetical protein [Candidatus Burkholderia verschuerenii]